jgi:succinate-semialdehyde dehydrogenase/glutarate-semialdehyde dehydrogenase
MSTQLKSYNPANGEVVGEVAITDVAQINNIVATAHQAASEWRKVAIEQRAKILCDAGEALQQQAETVGQLIQDEMGKTLKRAIGEVDFCGRSLPGKVAKIVKALAPEVTTKGPMEMTVKYDPLGVCAAISPWNFPVMMPHSTVIPALMAGNAVVLKPSEETPLSAQAYVDILNQFLPAGLLQIIHGADEQGKALVKADVNMIAFTGSRAAGANILGAASGQLKRVMLELGGKDPLIVLDDADIEQAAAMAVANSNENAGQTCISTERIYVDQAIAPQFEQRMAELTQAVTTGPMVNERQRKHVIKQIDQAVAQGATVLAGGTDHPPAYVRPTVLGNVSDDMDIMQTETFGPVVCISRFNNIDDAVKQANDSEYALGAAVYGQDEQRAWDVASQLSAGMIGVNKNCFTIGDMPWVGAKQSGYGFNGSAAGHRQFTQLRVLSRNIG